MAQAIDAMCFVPDGAFVGEFEHLFASLFSNDEIYRRIIAELASTRRGRSRDELLRAIESTSGGAACYSH